MAAKINNTGRDSCSPLGQTQQAAVARVACGWATHTR
jgi:hypothetical protein